MTLQMSECLPGARFAQCQDCRGMEPRPLIILAARYKAQSDEAAVRRAITEHLYHGSDITASEIVV